IINLKKSQLLGVGVPIDTVSATAALIGCTVLKSPFKYLGIKVVGNMSLVNAWEDSIGKIKARLSMCSEICASFYGIFASKFFNGIQGGDRKIAWVQWAKVLSPKNNGGLGVPSYYALNRALLFKWVWRFLSRDCSLWFRFITAIHGSSIQPRSSVQTSIWGSIIKEVHALKLQGVDLLAHCKLRVGSGRSIRFWSDVWIGDIQLSCLFPRLFALESNKDCLVAEKLHGSLDDSFRRPVRGGVEAHQFVLLQGLMETVVHSNVDDRWVWINFVPIKVNVFAWKLHLDRLPTRTNLARRGVEVWFTRCPACDEENISWSPVGSNADWLGWFSSIRLGSKIKGLLKGVFFVAWWSIWSFRNQLLFTSQNPRRSGLFDDIVTRSFTWCHARCKSSFSWDNWLQHPYLLSL
nr:RNA-directed DNA polymerase, eukaryota [Tanacetum cinerariifolium]